MGRDAWSTMLFDQCADLVRDTVHPSEVRDLPYIGLEHIREGQLSLSDHGSADQVTSIKSRFRKGDILFGKLRPYFRKLVIAPFDGVCSTDIWVIRHKPGIDRRYLFYWMASHEFIEEATRASEGTKMPRAQWEFVGRIKRLVPPLPEQRAIACILGTLDDKIELNRRMSETLEQMARALFKAWFIDFDPVRRNMARARGQNQPSPPAPLPGGEGRGHYRGGYDFAGLVEKARALRKKQTSAEALFWELVRDRRFMGLKFRRQHQLGDYVADFYCHEYRLVIELDGDIHAVKRKKDHKRDTWMQSQGFKVLRFKNEQLLDDPESVLTAIAHTVEELPSPFGRRAGDEGVVAALPSPSGRRAGDEDVIGGAAFDHLFPDRLVPSELGEIPEGWEVKSLDQIARFLNGLALQKYPPADGRSLPVIKIAQLRAGNTEGADRASADIDPDYIVQDGDILFSWSGSLECQLWAGGPGALNQHLFKVTSEQYPRWLCYLGIHQHLDDFRHIAAGKATTMGHIQRHHLSAAKLAVPPEPLLHAMNAVAEPIIEATWRLAVQSRTLAALRDALLPKLISGELRVKEAERFLRERGL